MRRCDGVHTYIHRGAMVGARGQGKMAAGPLRGEDGSYCCAHLFTATTAADKMAWCKRVLCYCSAGGISPPERHVD